MLIDTSYNGIRQLVGDINRDLKDMNAHNETLNGQLNTLGNTFQDDGIEIIRGHVVDTRRKINEAVPDFEIVLHKLLEYAALVEESERAIKNG
jgi:chemotaxis regulatin CheY-phosphate phosphatase CheZ